MNRFWVFSSALILILIAAVSFHFNPDNFIADDAYFYLQIANNISQGNGSTFQQITPTNGYHPLWMICCVFAASFTNGDRLVLLHLMALVQLIFYSISIYLLFRISKKMNLHFFIAGVFVLTFIMINSGGMRLFEGHLTIMLQLAALSLFIDMTAGARSKKLIFSLGVLLGLVFLARLDSIFFIIPIALVSVWLILKDSESLLQKFGSIILAAIPAALLAGAYLTHNLLYFGHIVPISGLIKSTYPISNFTLEALGPHGKVAVICSSILLSILLLAKRKGQKNVVVYAVLLVSIISHAAYTAAYSWGSQWYYTTAYVSLAIASMGLLSEVQYLIINYIPSFSTAYTRIVNLSILALMLLATTVTVSKTFYNFSLFMTGTGKQKIQHELTINPGKRVAEILKGHLKPGSSIYVFDAPGILAFYTDFKILPADGLMNDLAYDQDVLEMGIKAYLKEKNVHYYLGPMPNNDHTAESSTLKVSANDSKFIVEVSTPLSHKFGGSFHVETQDALVLPAPLRAYGDEQPSYALWKIN